MLNMLNTTTHYSNRPIVSYIGVTLNMLKTTRNLNRPTITVSYIRVTFNMLNTTHYLNRPILSYIRVTLNMLNTTHY